MCVYQFRHLGTNKVRNSIGIKNFVNEEAP